MRASGRARERGGTPRAGGYRATLKSIGVNIHLWGFTTSESASSAPFKMWRYSSRMAAGPAYAASTCSQRPYRFAIASDARKGIEARRRSRAERRNHAEGFLARGEVGFDRGFKRIRAHAELVVDRNVADVAATHSGGERGTIDGEIGVLGSVEEQFLETSAGVLARSFSGGDDGVHAGG